MSLNANPRKYCFSLSTMQICGVFVAVVVVVAKSSLLKRVRREYFPRGPGSVALQGMLGWEWNCSHYITGSR